MTAALFPEPDEVPRPTVKGGCLICRVTPEDVGNHSVIVSPTGLAHFGEDYGVTSCGKDATGDGWWWPV